MTKPLTVDVIGTVGVPGCYGGFETLVDYLVQGVKSVDFIVYCQSSAYREKVNTYHGARLVYMPFNANGGQSVIYDVLSMLYSLFVSRPKVILVLGVSGCVFLPFIRLFSRSKIVTNIDGLEWKRDKWGGVAKWFLKLSERFAVKYSHVVICDNAAITKYVKSEYCRESVEIAYGAPVVENGDDKEYVFGLCRIEPENNVHTILEAFKEAGTLLKFVGNWDSSEYGRALKAQYSRLHNIAIIGPIYDFETLNSLRGGCSYYVHGHSAGGTNPSLVEIMHYGKDVLCFDCSYNRESTEDSALYFSSVESLKELINTQSVEGRELRGAHMQEIARRRYRWDVICRQYVDVFRSTIE